MHDLRLTTPLHLPLHPSHLQILNTALSPLNTVHEEIPTNLSDPEFYHSSTRNGCPENHHQRGYEKAFYELRAGYLLTNYQIIGNGPSPAKGDRVTMEYTGWLRTPGQPEEKGKQFDSTTGRGPFATPIGVGRVIKGQ